MQFSLLIQGSPTSSQSLYSAYEFANAALAQGHRIQRAFFYQDAVLIGNKLVATPQDEFDIQSAWQALGKAHQIPLVLCVASCLRRGILDDREAERFEKSATSIAETFEIGGLGQLIDASLESERLITFRP
ncbi:MAG: sulfurtransferase complex subunit TusD [Gammaproteobacteria bacterium]|jgi:tRNA 2-thiouridine synthesizing protein D